jgi:predicted aldo/keto reductase-like oxidoreductase
LILGGESFMKTMMLGKTGLEVSRIGIGGIPILRIPFDEAVKVIQFALDLGINFIDTANAYASVKGSSEERIGQAIAGRREDVVLATKSSARDRDTSLEHLNLSLKRLETDYIEIWQFHGVNKIEAYESIFAKDGAMETAKEALESGTIRHIGFSSHVLDVAIQVVKSGHFEVVQYPFNFVNNDAATELIPLTETMNVGFVAMKPFAGGHLEDASLAIKYLLQFDNVLPDPGIMKFEEIQEIADIVQGPWDITAQEQNRIEEIRAELGSGFCRWCEYCMPCPQGVTISWVMNAHLVHSYGDRYYNNTTKAIETASECIQCSECESKCPYQLPIMDTIANNAEWFKQQEPYRLQSSSSQ